MNPSFDRFWRIASMALLAGFVAACGGGGGGGGDEDGSGSTPPDLRPVTDVFANPATAGANVGWVAPNAGTPTGYSISASADGMPTITQQVAAGSTSTSLTGLMPDMTYSIRVAAQYGSDSVSSAQPAVVHVPSLTNTPAQIAAYERAAAYSASLDGDAVLVMRDGQVVFERYADDYVSTDPHPLASGTKSFSCALMLAAEQDGLINREQRVADVITEWAGDPNKSRTTVRQLLSLQGGLSTNPDYSALDVQNQDTYQLAIEDPAAFAPGDAFIYDPLAFQAFALMFERRSSNTDPVMYLRRKVFTPIGLTGDLWQRDAQMHPQMAGGAMMTAAAWARYGQLMLQQGTWGGSRLLPASGVQDCLRYDNPAYRGYGITWWLNRNVGSSYDPSIDQIPPDGRAGSSGQIAPRAPEDMVMAAGTGRQRLYLLPSQRLVVVRLAPLATQFDDWSDDEFLARLLGNG